MDTAGGARPGRWALWRLPRRALGYVLGVELAAAVTVFFAVTTSRPGGWASAGLLAACAVLHLHASHAIERIRRDHSRNPHVDLCSVWTLAGALVLPATAEVALVCLVYLHRWLVVGRFDVSRPPHRAVFTATMMLLAALAANAVARTTGLHDHLVAGTLGWLDAAALLATLATHWAVNSGVVAGILLLTANLPRKRDVFGSRSDNLLEAGQLVLGAFAGFTVLWWAPVTLLMIVPLYLVHQSVLLHQLKLAARTDHRTGLLHAVAWQDQAAQELARACQDRAPLSLLLLDLDLFKRVNDRHGHLVGDDVLIRVAALLTATVRRGDAIGRYGGEEFAILQPGISRTEAVAVAERIRRLVGELDVRDDDGTRVLLSITIGVASWPETGETTIEGLLRAADAALYAGKAAGRNRVCTAAS